MKAVTQPKATNQDEIYTYIAIPIDALQQTSEQGVQSLRVTQNVILKALPDGNITQQIQPNKKGENLVIRALTKSGNVKTVLNKNNSVKNNSNLFVKVPGKVNSIVQNSGRPSVIEQNKNNQAGDSTRKSVISTPGLKTKTNSKKEVRYLNPKSSQFINSPFAKRDIQKHKCLICGEILDKVMRYRRHMQAHRNSKKFKCTLCSASYNIEDNLKLHMAMHNKGDPTCPICSKKFQRLASLRAHIINHEVEENYTCAECLAEFDKEDDYIKHLEAHKKEMSKTKIELPCTYCDQVFNDQYQYKEHVAYHTKVKKMMKGKKSRKRIATYGKEYTHKCHICEKGFAKFCLLERHMRIHSGEKPYECHLCDRTFTQKGTLQIHIARHAGIKPFSCTLCPAKFCQKGNLRVHVQKTHTIPASGEKVYKCTMCTCMFRRVSSLNTHITRAHAGDKADDISDIMEQLKQLEKHLDPQNTDVLKGEASKIDIPEDNKRVKSKVKSDSALGNNCAVKYVKLVDSSIEGTIRRYVVKQRKVDEYKWYMCSYCIKEFKKPSDLIRHIRVHTREKPFKCKQCDQAFSLKSTLTSHTSTHSGKRQFNCFSCAKSFTSMRTLNAHLRRHDKSSTRSVQTYKCNICSKVFTSSARVKVHMEVHKNKTIDLEVVMQQPMMETAHGLLPVAAPKFRKQYNEIEVLRRSHKCQNCPSAFVKGVHLKRHMLIHNGEKKHKCETCSKSFYSKYSLKEHQKFHSAERNFTCKTCGKKFVTNAILKRHAIIHSSYKPYVCPYCRKRFKTILLCRKHINTHKKEISIQMVALRETGELSNPEIAETVVQMDLQNSTLGNQQRNEPFNNFSNNPEMIKKINLNDSLAAKINLEFNKSQLPNKNSPVSKILFSNDSGIIISAVVENPVQSITDDLTNVNQSILQNAVNIQNYSDRPANLTLLSETTNEGDFINLDDTIASLAQEHLSENNEIEYPRMYINYDDLHAFTNSNLYNTCFSQLKTNDPLLMSGIGDVQDTNILFSTDPTLNQIGDIQLDPQNFETFIPLPVSTSLGANNLAFTGNPLNVSFPNIILSNATDTEINQSVALPSISEISKKPQVNLSSFTNIVIPGDKRLTENYNNKLDVSLTDDGIIMDMNQINQEGMILPNLSFMPMDSDPTALTENRVNFETTEPSTADSLNSKDDISLSDMINLCCKFCKQNLNTLRDLKIHNCSRKNKVMKGNKKKKKNPPSSAKRKSKRTPAKNNKAKKEEPSIKNDEGKAQPVSEKVGGVKTNKKGTKYKCDLCDNIFLNKVTLNRHMLIHKEKKQPTDNTCTYCAKTFKKRSDLERHVRTHTGEKPFGCDKCDKKFSLKSTLESHYRTHNPGGNKDFYCPVCSSYFSSKSSLRVHMLVHTGVKPYQCPLCPEKFRTSGHRKSHMAYHLNKNEKQKQNTKISDILSSIVMDSQTLMPITTPNNENIEISNVQQPTEYQNCPQDILQDKDLLYPHQSMQVDPLFLQFNNVLLQDNGDGQLPPLIQVDINNEGQITNMKSMLNNNGIDVIGGFENQLYDPLTLTEEGQVMQRPSNTKKEQIVTRNFECDVCHKKYTTKSVLSKHKKRHCNKSFKCAECDSAFGSQADLDVHVRVHLGYRPFYCQFCTNSFAYEKNLKAHVKRIHGTQCVS